MVGLGDPAKEKIWSRAPRNGQTGLQREVATEKALWLRVEGRMRALNKQLLAKSEAWPSQREDHHPWRQIAPRDGEFPVRNSSSNSGRARDIPLSLGNGIGT